MTFRYIGSKSRLINQIASHIGYPTDEGFFVDAFCGTGVVAEAAASLDWNIRVNDHLHSAVISAEARLLSAKQVKFKKIGGYSSVIDKLNNVQPLKGFMWRTYSPASFDLCGVERKYFTEENAAKIDAIRHTVAEWGNSDIINKQEERLLIADLFGALNRVANIAGTFGCFLSKWTKQSQASIVMQCRELRSNTIQVETSVGDVFQVPNNSKDLVYLDPPYTKRQYASYYHILETVALGDEPQVEGVAGLRPWKGLASVFCYKTKALDALLRLIQNLSAQRVLLSYSSEGHICIQDLSKKLLNFGEPAIYSLGTIGRYRPNKVASCTNLKVNEFLVAIDCTCRRHVDSIKSSILAENAT